MRVISNAETAFFRELLLLQFSFDDDASFFRIVNKSNNIFSPVILIIINVNV